MLEGLTASAADMQDENRLAFDGEQDAVDMRLASIKQVTNLERKALILRRYRAALGQFGERRDCLFESLKPA